MSVASWTLVIPVKPLAIGKSRLRGGMDLTRAIALDTVAAAVGDAGTDVVIVTADASLGREAERLGAQVVLEQRPAGIAQAIQAGFDQHPAALCRAALLGDLPFLRPDELAAALELAAVHPRAFVADSEGTGTTLVTASAGTTFFHQFGPESAQRHRASGLVELDVAASSGLRRDVDVPEHLLDAQRLGPRTRAALIR